MRKYYYVLQFVSGDTALVMGIDEAEAIRLIRNRGCTQEVVSSKRFKDHNEAVMYQSELINKKESV